MIGAPGQRQRSTSRKMLSYWMRTSAEAVRRTPLRYVTGLPAAQTVANELMTLGHEILDDPPTLYIPRSAKNVPMVTR